MLIKLCRDKLPGNKVAQWSELNKINKDQQQKEADDEHLHFINVDINEKTFEKKNVTISSKVNRLIDQEKLTTLRQCVLFIAFLERFVEMVVVLTILAISWMSLRFLVEDNILSIRVFVIISVIVILFMNCLLRSISCLGQSTGYISLNGNNVLFVLKKIQLLFLIGVHFLFVLDYPNAWSPYVAVIAAGTAGTTYILLSILSITQTVFAKGEGLYLYGLIIPLYVLFISQPVYLCVFFDCSYKLFMRNVGVGVLLAMLFCYENIFLTKACINSKTLEEFAKRERAI